MPETKWQGWGRQLDATQYFFIICQFFLWNHKLFRLDSWLDRTNFRVFETFCKLWCQTFFSHKNHVQTRCCIVCASPKFPRKKEQLQKSFAVWPLLTRFVKIFEFYGSSNYTAMTALTVKFAEKMKTSIHSAFLTIKHPQDSYPNEWFVISRSDQFSLDFQNEKFFLTLLKMVRSFFLNK